MMVPGMHESLSGLFVCDERSLTWYGIPVQCVGFEDCAERKTDGSEWRQNSEKWILLVLFGSVGYSRGNA
jgi:hypothetical protein